MPDISIIIVAYNPDFKVFGRCLDAVAGLRHAHYGIECLLVDNNSSPSLEEHPLVQNFLQKCPWTRVLVEKRQGSGFARICGYRNSKAPVLVTFDDDNEPEENYLLEVMNWFQRMPGLGVVGPGIVNVEFVDKTDKWLERYRYIFQEFHMHKEKTGRDTPQPYPDYYPYGTGMVMRKEAAMHYSDAVEQGRLTSIGRIGKILTSCEDLQLVWLCLKELGYAAGRSPALQLNHLINDRKTNFRYLKKLTYGGAYSFLPARFELFPEEKKTVANTGKEFRKSLLRVGKITMRNFYRPRFVIISLIGQVGILDSIYYLNGKRSPGILSFIKKIVRIP